MTTDKRHDATRLAYAGLAPFVLLGLARIINLDGHDYDLALRAYGAVILSFLCGTHWAISLFVADTPRRLLIYSNLIALIGWWTVYPHRTGLAMIVQSICFMTLLTIEYRLTWRVLIPDWYFRLRRNVTMYVVGILLITACLA